MKTNNEIRTIINNRGELRKVPSDVKEQQKLKADALALNDQKSLLASMDRIRKIDNPKSADISENSRVNEQDVFAAIVENSLGQLNPELSSKFGLVLGKELEALKPQELPDLLLKAVRRSLNTLIKDNQLSRYAAKQIRKFALGKSQLDDLRGKVSVAKENPDSSETPLRAVKTALAKIAENAAATAEEFDEFKKQGRAVAA